MDKSVLQVKVIKHLLAACSVASEKCTVKPNVLNTLVGILLFRLYQDEIQPVCFCFYGLRSNMANKQNEAFGILMLMADAHD